MNIDARMLKGNSYLSDNYQKALLGPRFQTWSSPHTLWKRYPRTTKWTRPKPFQVGSRRFKVTGEWSGTRRSRKAYAHFYCKRRTHICLCVRQHPQQGHRHYACTRWQRRSVLFLLEMQTLTDRGVLCSYPCDKYSNTGLYDKLRTELCLFDTYQLCQYHSGR